MNARPIQRAPSFRGMGDCSISASKFFGMEIIDLVLTGAVHSAEVGSGCAGLAPDTGGHEVRSSGVCCVGDTR